MLFLALERNACIWSFSICIMIVSAKGTPKATHIRYLITCQDIFSVASHKQKGKDKLKIESIMSYPAGSERFLYTPCIH